MLNLGIRYMSIGNLIGSLLKNLSFDDIQMVSDATYVPIAEVNRGLEPMIDSGGPPPIYDWRTGKEIYKTDGLFDEIPKIMNPRTNEVNYPFVMGKYNTPEEVQEEIDRMLWNRNGQRIPELITTEYNYDRDGYNPLKDFGPIGTHKPEEDESKILPLSFLEGFMNEIAGVPYTLPDQKLFYKGGDGKVKSMMSPLDLRSDKEKWLNHMLRYRV